MRNDILRKAVTCCALCALVSCFSERSTAPVDRVSGAQLCGSDPGANVVQIRDYAFHPAELQVSTGTVVTWVNCDADAHTSTATGGAWNSGLLARHQTYAHTFTQTGRFDYRCEPHPFMTGAVVVR